MKMKCIGGLNDGEWMDMPAFLSGERTVMFIKPKIDEHRALLDGISVQDTFTIERELYRVATVCEGETHARVQFLCPNDWATIRAIDHLVYEHKVNKKN